MSGKNVEMVKVTIEIPRALHNFLRKWAQLEGHRAEDWYETWIPGDFEALLDEISGLDIDMKSAIEHNGLKDVLEERSPSFVKRFLCGD